MFSNSFVKKTVFLIALGGIIFLFIKFPITDMLLSFVSLVQSWGWIGYVSYAAVYAAGVVILMPGSILTLGAGFAYGVVFGSILVSFASTTGATLAFIVGRYLARDWVLKKISTNPSFKKIDKAVGKKGFKIVFLTRLSPVFPFSLQNYAYGLTSVSLKDYFFASWIGMIPGTVMYVYFGSLITEISQIASGKTEAHPSQNILYGAGLIVTVIVTIYITKIARKALKEHEAE